MDDAALSLGAIDVSYSSSSAECTVSRCKHSSEEWGECNSRPTVFRSATLKWKETLLGRKRPFVGRCCYVCTPQSRDKLFNPSIPSLGLRNVIYINETHTRHRGWLARRLCYVLFVQERDVHKRMFANNVAENVLNSSRVLNAIVEEASEMSAVGGSGQPDPRIHSKVKKKARRIVQEMVANVSPFLIRLTGWVLLKLFNSFFWNIQIHKGQLEMVKAATELNLPLIFLPVHKSHIDYLLLTFILFCHNIKAPYIAAGNNLNIPIFRLSGLCNRGLGIFFPDVSPTAVAGIFRGVTLKDRLSFSVTPLKMPATAAGETSGKKIPGLRLHSPDNLQEPMNSDRESLRQYSVLKLVKTLAPAQHTLIHKLGGFFIRRKLDESPDGRKDVLYRALLHVHVQELLRQQQFLEIFLEGTRSRSGKASYARAGLLSVVVDALYSNAAPDILIIPVGISYDRIIEGHYNSEQLGKPKKNESLWSVARGVFRMLRKNYGCVRVDFAQPFSLKEYLDGQSQKPVPVPHSLAQTLLPAVLPSRPNCVVEEGTEDTVADSRDVTCESLRRQLIANLAEHIMFTANKSCAVMSTHIVACLLLYRHRQGIDLSKLVEDFFSMKEEVLARDYDLGFSGNSEDVVMHAIHLLGNCITITNTSRNNEFFITPSTSVPAVFELSFYSNGVLHVFFKEAIIACSLHAIQNRRHRNGVNGISPNMISQEQLVRKAASLCYLLSNEGTVSLPCQLLCQVCHEAVERFIQYGILLVAEDDQEEIVSSLAEQHWEKKLPGPLSWRSDEEDEDSDFGEEQRDCYLKVSQSQEHQQYITFLQKLLGPLLEAYSSAAIFIHNFSCPVRESEYLQKLHKYLITRTEKNVAVYAESATYCLAKNAVKVFKDMGVFKETKQKQDSILELSSTFLPHCHRQKLLEFILGFVVL